MARIIKAGESLLLPTDYYRLKFSGGAVGTEIEVTTNFTRYASLVKIPMDTWADLDYPFPIALINKSDTDINIAYEHWSTKPRSMSQTVSKAVYDAKVQVLEGRIAGLESRLDALEAASTT